MGRQEVAGGVRGEQTVLDDSYVSTPLRILKGDMEVAHLSSPDDAANTIYEVIIVWGLKVLEFSRVPENCLRASTVNPDRIFAVVNERLGCRERIASMLE
jgi:hypothetical protein